MKDQESTNARREAEIAGASAAAVQRSGVSPLRVDRKVKLSTDGPLAADARLCAARIGANASSDPQANWASMPTGEALSMPAGPRQRQIEQERTERSMKAEQQGAVRAAEQPVVPSR
ncbi:hypothetical protein [Lysobacter enzymogenes]|uniref:hypothetical protein n=1 Tax=Lysobacter enzymogenes TaxID=69 RepID=UPI001116043D|nr:hypothetical protein [Lysobacter enzymogenes]UZW62172.1 hypothetical protein BV903_007755 [Lysobacter enzymogenes]